MIYNVLSYLEQAVGSHPDRVALADRDTQYTYAQVWEHVQRGGSALAHRLRAPGRPVIVCLTHSAWDVLAFYSVIYSGNFYVPMDLSLPEGRLRDMLGTVMPAGIIAPDISALPFDSGNVPLWATESLFSCDASPQPLWKTCKDTDLLYIIFTSGSSGSPKGVAISHRSVIDMVEQFADTFGFADGTVFGSQAPFDFDGSVKDLYITLKTAGRMEILEKQLFSFPALLIRRMNERKVDTVFWAVSALKIMESLKAFKKSVPQYLKNVLFAGEVLPAKALAYWQRAMPDVRYVNLYGPTEITCNCTYYIVDGPLAADGIIPIGRAFPNCSVFLLDGDEPVTEPDRPGELCVSGSCLALGYYRRPELTAAAFTPNPLQTGYTELMYRTGDRAFYRPDGMLVFLGRKDAQIKHMGYRIELSEIELCANRIDGVTVSACAYMPEKSRIALFYQGEAEPEALRGALRAELPRYMLPVVIKNMDAMPATHTGKIDRNKLLEILRQEDR